jgi:hypothetical protein
MHRKNGVCWDSTRRFNGEENDENHRLLLLVIFIFPVLSLFSLLLLQCITPQKKREIFGFYCRLLSIQYAPMPMTTATATATRMATSVVGNGASPLGSSLVGGAVVGASDVGGAVVGGAVVGGAVVGGAVVGGAVVGGSVSGSAAEGAGPTVT